MRNSVNTCAMPNPKIPIVLVVTIHPQSFFKHEAKTTGPEILKHLGRRGVLFFFQRESQSGSGLKLSMWGW